MISTALLRLPYSCAIRRRSALVKLAIKALLVGLFALVGSRPVQAQSPSDHTTSASELRHYLLGRWARRKKAMDGRSACVIDISIEFRADGRFLYTRTFHRLDHRRPTWDSLINPGTWQLRKGVLMQHWDGNGEHPGGYTTRWAVIHLSAKQLRYVEGVDGAVSYHRPSKPVRSAAKPNAQ